jgi:hypothetical protein
MPSSRRSPRSSGGRSSQPTTTDEASDVK